MKVWFFVSVCDVCHFPIRNCLPHTATCRLTLQLTPSSPNAMGFRKISSDMKECALKLWDQGWETANIMDTLGISQSSLYQWQTIFDQYGSVKRPSAMPKGPERIITQAVLTAVQTLYKVDSDLYLDELVPWLAIEHGIKVSVSALHSTLVKVGLQDNPAGESICGNRGISPPCWP